MARFQIKRHALVALFSATAGIIGGCDGGGAATLRILEPVDGARLTLATDTRPDLDGVQATVQVEAFRVSVGERVDLVLEDGTIVGTELVTESGDMTFADVTFPAGTYDLVAVTRTGDVRSPTIEIVVDDACASIDFVTPEPTGGTVTLGPEDDTDGISCGESFETTVVVATDAGDGAEARVFVNGTPRRTGRVAGSTARFEEVSFDLATANTLTVEVVNAEGVACRRDFPAPIEIDCAGVLCQITRPDTSNSFLNQNDDSSDEDGFQTDFEVTTDEDGAGQDIRLVIDGNETDALSATPSPSGMGGVATFGNVPLSEGVHRIQAICTDATGNRTRTSAEWTVDVTPCELVVDQPAEGDLFTDAEDLDPEAEGIQIDVAGSVSGSECTGLRVGLCDGLGDFETSTAGSFDRRVSLSSSATQRLCAESRDQAGNVQGVEVGIRVRTDAPQLQIATPTTGSAYNALGTGGRTADLTPTSGTCEAAFSVLCTDIGSTVEIVRVSTDVVLSGGTATCTAAEGLPAPYVGQATFTSVSLPSLESLEELQVQARSTVDRVVGRSDPIALLTDCQAPVVDVTRPTCGATLRPTDDENAAVEGIQYRVEVRNTNVPKPPVTLELRSTDGTVVHGPVTSSTPATGIITQFAGVPFQVGGDVQIATCATDAAGNVGCSPECRVSVQDIPTLAITQPTSGAVLSSSSDCDPARPGLQIRVRATTDAASGSMASIQIGTATAEPASVSAGVVDACVDAADGRSVPVRVTVTDPVRGASSASVTVSIDTLPPTGAIVDLVLSEEDRRRGVARFRWTAVEDAGGLRLERYQARCAREAITSEAQWTSATPVTITVTPGSAGAMQSETVPGFRPREARHCVVRGVDLAGALTPLPTTPPAPYAAALLEQTVAGTAGSQLGAAISPVGDVNGDGFDDVVVTALNGTAFLHFGSSSGLSATRVTLRGPAAVGGFGRVVSPLGDFNGDGRADFAVSARALTSNSGAVWIVFGRTSWPTELALNESACGAAMGAADVCLIGTQAGALFGWSLASAGDFDGDGTADLAIGAWQANAGAGRLYVVLGSSATTSGTRFDFPNATADMNPRSFVVEAPMGVVRMGESATTPGDFRGADGRHDLVISASGNAATATLGRVYTVAGRAHPGTGLVTIPGAEVVELASGEAGAFGRLVRAIGDYDGNGRVDVAVFSAVRRGQVFIYLQGTSGFSSSSVVDVTNDIVSSEDDLMGNSTSLGYTPFLGRFGDFDGDTVGDLLVGSVQRGAGAGGVDLFYGRSPAAARVRSTSDLVLEPMAAGLERVASFVGDINGDGFTDVMVGDPGFTSNTGQVVLIY